MADSEVFEAVGCFVAEAVKAIDAYDHSDSWRSSAEWLTFIEELVTKCADSAYSAGMRAGEIARTERPKLCYVEADVAYFTTQELDKQRGDDWNDAPYEHNAGTPYGPYGPYRPGDDWTITELHFAGDFQVPCDGHCNSPWTVQQINKGFCPWLRTHQDCIMAGATVEEFCKFITENGGAVALPAAPEEKKTAISGAEESKK